MPTSAGAWVYVGGVLKRKGRPDRAIPTLTRPTGTGYVTYESLYTSGNTFQQVLNKVTNGDVLTLPAGTFEFSDFANGFYEGVRVPTACGGIWGSGSNTIIRMTAGTSTKASDTTAVPPSSGTNQCFLIGVYHSNTVLRNFQLQGTSQGHSYNGIRIAGTSSAVLTGILCQDVFFNGCWPGYANFPPGECMGFNTNHTDNVSLINCEFDGRDPVTRAKTCASPFGWNNSTNAYVQDVYAHHAKTGMPTFYVTNGVHTVRLRSEYNGSGSGSLNSHGINHEGVSGTVLHESPTLLIDRASGNTGMHISLQNGDADNPNVTLTDVTHDAGGGAAGCFGVQISDSYVAPTGGGQKQTSLPHITKGGVTLVGLDSSNTTGATPSANFIRWH